ncbi:MAG: GGDEF domain-containing protein [Roseburia sp.]
MTEHYNRLDQAEMSAHVDALTGLWDREQFKISMLDELYQNGAGTMFMMDVDNFKEVNDHYGHDIGDKVLRTLGTAIRETCQNEHLCGRLGGDEFCLFLKEITEEAEIQKYAKKVAALYKEKIALLPDHVKSSMSIGAVVVDIGKHNTARDTFEQVYRSADEAMYRSKRNGKDTWQICTYHGEAEHGAETV